MKRRDFLKTAALGAVAAGAGTTLLGGCTSDKPKTFNFNKINDSKMLLSFQPYDLLLKNMFTVSAHSRLVTPGVQVKIQYQGFTGYGEAAMPPYLGEDVLSVMNFLRKTDITQFNDPSHIEDILSYVDSLSSGDYSAKAAVDIALHDLVGKMLGAPWWRLWGLDPSKAPDTTYTIGIDVPDVVRKKTRECAGQFNILKVKVGLDNDKEMIETIREITDVPLAVDANQGWKDREKALDEIFWLKEKGVVLVEQPMAKERIDDNAWITEHSPIPVFADEAVRRLKDIPSVKGAYHGINIKLMKSTGMREAWKMLNYAKAEDMKVMLGCMTETSCGISAAAQLSPAADFADLDGNLLISNDIFKGVQVVNGKITLSDKPGIGIEKLQ